MGLANGSGPGGVGGWLLFGHLLGVALLAVGVGAYVAGLHRFALLTSLALLAVSAVAGRVSGVRLAAIFAALDKEADPAERRMA